MKKSKTRVRIDFTGVQPGSGGFRIEPGEYKAECLQVIEEESSTGNPMLTWTFQLQEGTANGRRLRYWTSLAPQALWKLQSALEAFGEDAPTSIVDLELSDYEGRSVIIVVEDNLYDGKTVSKVSDLLRADDDEEEDETPTTAARKAAKAAAEEEDETEDVPFEEDEEEEKPAKKGKLKPLDIEDVKAMTAEALKKVISQYGLEVDLSKYRTDKAKQNAIIDALEEAGYLAEA
jgi:hypothetical protein